MGLPSAMASGTNASRPRIPRLLESSSNVRLEDGAVLSECRIQGSFVDESAASVELQRCHVVDSLFTSCRLPDLRLVDVLIENCDLSGAVLDAAILTRVQFSDCRLSAVDLSRGSLRDVHFIRCRLDTANLRMSDLERVSFDDVDLRGADFVGSKLPGARVFDCNLEGADFSKVSAGEARIHGSIVTDIRGANYLTGVIIDSNQVVPLAVQLLSTMAIVVDDDREPERPR
jgi:uncharacterized protein YjbI with pentapeptide repeats